MQDKVKMFRDIVNGMADLYEMKNANYGDSFGKLFNDLGPTAGLVPLHNKLDRATNLVKGGQNNFESLEDTFKDLACYAIMNLIEMKAKEEPKREDVINYVENLLGDTANKTVTAIDPCKTCYKWNTSYGLITDPCAGCPHNKNPYPVVTCNSGGQNNE